VGLACGGLVGGSAEQPERHGARPRLHRNAVQVLHILHRPTLGLEQVLSGADTEQPGLSRRRVARARPENTSPQQGVP